MNYDEFADEMIREVEHLMKPEVKVKKHCASKNNGAKKVALVIVRKDVNISPTIYLEEFYEQYQQGISVSKLAKCILDFYENVCVKTSVDVERIFIYDNIKDKIAYRVINKEKNKEMLESIPHKEILDLAIVYYLLLDDQELGTATVTINKEHLKYWGITEQDLFERARINTEKILPSSKMCLTDVMYVHTNESGYLGAAVILYSDVLKKEYERLGENFYIIPSSIHEIIVVPESFGMNRIEMENMLRSINASDVREEEILSDYVYYYMGKEERIIL